MKIIITLLIATVSFISASQIQNDSTGQLQKELIKSLDVTDACLSELKVYHSKLINSNKKVAKLQKENKLLAKENSLLKKELSLALTDIEYKNIINAKNKSNSIVRLKKEVPLLDEDINLAKNSVNKRDFLHKRSLYLLKKYGKLSKKKLFSKNIYRVPVHMLNVRTGHSRKYRIASIARKGELVEFSDVYLTPNARKTIVWLKIKKGWMYVPSRKDSKYFMFLAIKSSKSALYQSKGGDVR